MHFGISEIRHVNATSYVVIWSSSYILMVNVSFVMLFRNFSYEFALNPVSRIPCPNY